MHDKPEPRLDYAEAADYLGMTERALKRAVAAGKVDHYKLGGLRTTFTRSQLDAYLAASLNRATRS